MKKLGDGMKILVYNRKKKNIMRIGAFLLCLLLCFINIWSNLNIVFADELDKQDVKYLLSVNRVGNCITVYRANDAGEFKEPFMTMTCSTAADKESTPIGTFNLKDKLDWGVLSDGTYSPYLSRIDGNVLFVGSAYFSVENSDLDVETYNQLGESVTGNGCIRLSNADAKWIYDNCPKGTQVDIYDDEMTPGPIGKPDSIKIPVGHENAGWDPTDPDDNNPWKSHFARIEGIHDIELNEGSMVEDLFDGVIAYDTCGNDITSDIILMGAYNLSKPGDYSITYYVEDPIGSIYSEDIKVKVKGLGTQKETTQETVTIVTQEQIDARKERDKAVSVVTLGVVSLLLTIILLKWAKKE